jgi:hypothetical protein
LKDTYFEYTGKKAKYIFENFRTILKQGENLIKIKDYSEALFDKADVFYWKGDKWKKNAPFHLACIDKGTLKYDFKINGLFDKVLIEFTACSQRPNKKSKIYLKFGSVNKRIILNEKSPSGDKISVVFDNLNIKNKDVSLEFIVKDNGLSLFGEYIKIILF